MVVRIGGDNDERIDKEYGICCDEIPFVNGKRKHYTGTRPFRGWN